MAYLGVKMGLFGTNSTLIPVEIIRVNDRRHLVEVSESAETIKHAPHFGQETVSPELEDRVRNYYGLDPLYSYDELHDPQGPRPPIPWTGPRTVWARTPGWTRSRERGPRFRTPPLPPDCVRIGTPSAAPEPAGEPVGEPAPRPPPLAARPTTGSRRRAPEG